MIVIEISPPVTQIDPPVKDKVNVVCQFFIHPNSFRQKELEFCLEQLVKNHHIDNIY